MNETEQAGRKESQNEGFLLNHYWTIDYPSLQ